MDWVARDKCLDRAVRHVAKRVSPIGYRRVLQTWMWCGVPKIFVTLIGKEFDRLCLHC